MVRQNLGGEALADFFNSDLMHPLGGTEGEGKNWFDDAIEIINYNLQQPGVEKEFRTALEKRMGPRLQRRGITYGGIVEWEIVPEREN